MYELNSLGATQPSLYQTTITKATALSESFTPEDKVAIRQITIHASASVANDLTITLDSLHGSIYDTKILTVASGWQDAFITFGAGELLLGKQAAIVDQLLITCTNGGGATISIVITAERI